MLKPTLFSFEFQNGWAQISKKSQEIGIICWDSGDMYIGHLKDLKLFGKGLFLFSNKSMFYASFIDNNIEGLGLYRCFSGNIHLATWHSNKEFGFSYDFDKKEGVARIRNENGDVLCEKKVDDEQGFSKFIEDTHFRKSLLKFDQIIDKISNELNPTKDDNSICSIKLSHKLEYLGFCEQGEANGLGVFFEGKQVFCLGNFEVILFKYINDNKISIIERINGRIWSSLPPKCYL